MTKKKRKSMKVLTETMVYLLSVMKDLDIILGIPSFTLS